MNGENMLREKQNEVYESLLKESMKEHPILKNTFPKSSNVKEIEYDSFMKVLTVRFVAGGVYDFIGVEKGLYEQFCEAESAGKFFNEQVKKKYDTFNKSTKKKEKIIKEKSKRVSRAPKLETPPATTQPQQPAEPEKPKSRIQPPPKF
jgi:hypothetical protein